MESFLAWSGWFFGLIGVIFGIIQLVKKEEYKKKYKIEIEKNNRRDTFIHAESGGVAIDTNHGGININKP